MRFATMISDLWQRCHPKVWNRFPEHINIIQNPNSKIQNPKLQDPQPKLQDPKPKLQDPKSKTPRSTTQTKIQNRNSKIQNPKLQDPKSKLHLPFWGSKIGYKARCIWYTCHLIGYKARCIWYTCHFGGPRSATKPGVSDTPAILGVQDRLQSQVYLIHLPFWGSKIGYKARCIWYTCHFGGPRSATKPGVSDTPAILGVRDRLQSQVYLIHLPFWGSEIGYKARCIWYTCHFGGPRSATKSKFQNPRSKIQTPRSRIQDGRIWKVWNHMLERSEIISLRF